MAMLDKLTARYAEQVKGQALLHVNVGDIGEVFFKAQKSMNATEYNVLMTAAQNLTFESMVDILILRARYEDGRKMFRPMDKGDLMKQVAGEDIQEIVNAIFEADTSGDIDAKK